MICMEQEERQTFSSRSQKNKISQRLKSCVDLNELREETGAPLFLAPLTEEMISRRFRSFRLTSGQRMENSGDRQFVSGGRVEVFFHGSSQGNGGQRRNVVVVLL